MGIREWTKDTTETAIIDRFNLIDQNVRRTV